MPGLANVGVNIISSCEYRAQSTVSSRAHASEHSNEHNRPLQDFRSRHALSCRRDARELSRGCATYCTTKCTHLGEFIHDTMLRLDSPLLAKSHSPEPTERSPLCEGNGGSSLLAMLGKLAAAVPVQRGRSPARGGRGQLCHLKNKKNTTFSLNFFPGTPPSVAAD